MKRSKSSEVRDRLSELPDSVILDILSLLPLRDVVATTILSKRWNDLWISVPSLIFEAKTNSVNSPDAFRNFVNWAMLHWKGTKLQKLSVNFNFRFYSFDVDTWLHIAIEKGVEELSLDLNRNVYSPPQSFYSCSTIRKASLVRCNLDIKGDVQWSRLTSLRIEVEWLSDVAIKKVLSGAPHMEILILGYANVDGGGILNIKSKSLKRLKIERNMMSGGNYPRISTVRICTPNIKTLEISGIPYCEYVLVNASSLTRVNVGFNPVRYHTGTVDFLKGLLKHFFPNICRPEKLTLSFWFVKMIRVIKKVNKHMVAPFSDVKFLTLYATCIVDVVDILEIFPALTTLVILHEMATPKYPHFFEIVCPSKEACISEFEPERSLEPNSDFLMPHVRAVEITWADHDNWIFSFIETLSRNVRKLEKMVLRLTDTGSGATGVRELGATEVPWLRATEKLVIVQKLFPAAELILCQD